ncbi:diaminopimelate epimerase, partial [Dysosmobacter welbionis]
EVGEQHRDEQDHAYDDVVDPQGACVHVPEQAGEEGEQQGDEAADLHHKHHGVTHHIAGIELDERTLHRPPEDLRGDKFLILFLTHMKTPSLGPQGQMLCDGAKRQRGEEGQRCEDVDYEHQDHSEGQGVRAQGAHGLVDKPLAHQGTGDGQLDHDGQVPAEEHGQACGDVPEVAVVCQTLKAGAVVGRGRGVLIQHLAQAVEARVGDSLQAAGGGDRQRGEEQDQEGMDDDAQRGELHLPALDLLAQVFGRTANHQATDEHCQDGVHNHVHQADALAAEDH